LLIQHIVLCGRNPVFIINGLFFEIRFRYLAKLDSCTPLQLAQPAKTKGRAK